MVRILHVSDTHLGARQYGLDIREEDIYETFRQVIDIAINERVDAVIHTGDLFDKNTPPVSAISLALRELKRLKEKGIPFIAIAGNHDAPKRSNEKLPQRILEEEERLILLDLRKPQYKVADIEIYGISYIPITAQKTLKETLSKLKPSSKKSILMLHQAVSPFLPYQGIHYELEVSDLPKGFGIIALGHIHNRYKDVLDGGTIVEIPGSPDIIRADEIESYERTKKGVTLIDYSKQEPEITYINTDVRPQLKVTINTTKLEDDVKAIINSLLPLKSKKPILHITLEGTPVKKSVIITKLKELSKVAEYYRIAHDNTSYITDSGQNVKTPTSSSLDEMIFTYLTKVANYSESDAKLIISLLKEENEEEIEKILIKFAGLDQIDGN